MSAGKSNVVATLIGYTNRVLHFKVNSPKKLAIIISAFFVAWFFAGVAIIYHTYTSSTEDALDRIIQRVQDDIDITDGSWDLARYNADPVLPGRFRMYVFSADGFVVDRWRPIAGYLDTSDFKNLLTYQKPQTVSTIANETWRMYARPIKDDSGATIGAITTSYFNPDPSRLDKADAVLADAAAAIHGNIVVEDGQIDVSEVDGRSVPLEVSYQVVDQYNGILSKSRNTNQLDRTPDFIDSSYLKQELESASSREVRSQDGDSRFLVKSAPLTDGDGNRSGVIVVGTTISLLYEVLFVYFLLGGLLGGAVVGVFLHFMFRFIKTLAPPVSDKPYALREITAISFSPKDAVLTVNDRSIKLTYATNQYCLCKAIFSAPKKRWENDELIEKFGEELNSNTWRKVYDAHAAINNKVAKIMKPELITINNKTYRLNPKLVEKLK